MKLDEHLNREQKARLELNQQEMDGWLSKSQGNRARAYFQYWLKDRRRVPEIFEMIASGKDKPVSYTQKSDELFQIFQAGFGMAAETDNEELSRDFIMKLMAPLLGKELTGLKIETKPKERQLAMDLLKKLALEFKWLEQWMRTPDIQRLGLRFDEAQSLLRVIPENKPEQTLGNQVPVGALASFSELEKLRQEVWQKWLKYLSALQIHLPVLPWPQLSSELLWFLKEARKNAHQVPAQRLKPLWEKILEQVSKRSFSGPIETHGYQELLEESLRLFPDSELSRLLFAQWLIQNTQWEQAQTQLQPLLKSPVLEWKYKGLIQVGRIFYLQKKWSEAQKPFEQAFQLFSDRGDAAYYLAYLAYQRKENTQAMSFAKKALAAGVESARELIQRIIP